MSNFGFVLAEQTQMALLLQTTLQCSQIFIIIKVMVQNMAGNSASSGKYLFRFDDEESPAFNLKFSTFVLVQ